MRQAVRTDAAASVIKHNNPCGAASAGELSLACRKAMLGDPVSAFGSILGFNQEVDEATAEFLTTPGLFIEAIIAPKFSAAALEILSVTGGEIPRPNDSHRYLASQLDVIHVPPTEGDGAGALWAYHELMGVAEALGALQAGAWVDETARAPVPPPRRQPGAGAADRRRSCRSRGRRRRPRGTAS